MAAGATVGWAVLLGWPATMGPAASLSVKGRSVGTTAAVESVECAKGFFRDRCFVGKKISVCVSSFHVEKCVVHPKSTPA